MKVKQFFWLTPLALFLLLFLFWDALFSSFVQCSVKHYCKHIFGTQFSAEHSEIQGNVWILTNVKLRSTKQSGLHIDIKKLSIALEPHLLKREVDLAILLEDPEIEVDEETRNLQEMIANWYSASGLFKVNPKIEIQNGALHLKEKGHQKVFFNGAVDLWQEREALGRFQVYFNQPNEEQNSLILNVNKASDKILGLDFIFSKIDCSKSFFILKALFAGMNDWTLHEGLLDGKCTLHLENESMIMTQMDSLIKHLSFEHKQSGLQGSLPETLIHFSENSRGEIKLIEDASLIFRKNQDTFFSLKHLMGSLQFLPQKKLNIVLSGVGSHQQTPFNLQIVGEGDYQNDKFFKLQAISDYQQKKLSTVRIQAQQVNNRWESCEIEVDNLDQTEFALLKPFYEPYFQQFGDICFEQGSVNASLALQLDENKVKNIKVTQFEGEQLKFGLYNASALVEIDRLFGVLEWSLLSHHRFNALDADLMVENGLLQWQISQSDLLIFKEINTRLQIDHGTIRNSQIQANLGGLKGAVTFDWMNPKELAKLNFSGEIKDLLSLIPSEEGQRAIKQLQEEKAVVSATVSRDEHVINIQGKIDISSPDNALPENTLFGFEVVSVQTNDSSFSLPQESSLDLEVIKKNLPTLLLPIALAQRDRLEREQGVAGLVIKNGWFKTQNVPLEKYLSPFLFSDGKMRLSGKGDFWGNFDHKNLGLEYSGHDLLLESEDLTLSLNRLGNVGENGEERRLARHFFDFVHRTNFGVIPIRNGAYFEKNSGILFTDINATAFFEGKKIHLAHLDCFSTGVHFMGSLDIDYSRPEKGVFDTDIHLDSMDGKFSQIQHLFSHFSKPFFFVKIPLEGLVTLKGKGGHLRFEFAPDDYHFFAHIEGEFLQGSSQQKSDLSLHELSLDFEYDHAGNYLNLTDIQGTLLVGDPDHVEEYSFSGDHIHFVDYAKDEAEFDLWIGDKQRDIIRVVGKTNQSSDEAGIEFVFDRELTHFGDVHPELFKLTLKDWEEVKTFELVAKFKLNTFLHDIQRFSRSGFLFLSRHFLKELNDLKSAAGDLALRISYADTVLNFAFLGKEVVVGEKRFENVVIQGKKRNHIWMVDQLQLDDISVSAEFLRTEKSWKINFAGLSFGEALLIGLDGEILDGSKGMTANINLLEADLALLKQRPSLKMFIQNFSPKGHIRAKGKLYYEFGKGPSGVYIEALLNTSFRSCEIKGIKLKDAENVSCHFVTDKGLTIRNLSSAFLQDNGVTLTSFNLEKGYFDFISEQISLEGFHFKTPADALDTLLDAFQKSFTDSLKHSIVSLVNEFKTLPVLEGTVYLDLTPPYYSFRLNLKDGLYPFYQRTHDLKNFVLELSPDEFKLTTKYKHHQGDFWVLFYSEPPFLESGKLVLSDVSFEEAFSEHRRPPLTMFWEQDPKEGFAITQLEGFLAGIECHLWQDPESSLSQESQHLTGVVKVNMTECTPLLSEELSKTIQDWQIGDGYSLKGKWKFLKEAPQDSLEFQGILEGKNFEFKGYQFESLMAHLHYKRDALNCLSVNLRDPAGAVYIDQINCHLGEQERWKFYIPTLLMNEFRPSRLRTAGSSPSQQLKPLIISQLDLSNIQGELGDENSFTGQGKLFFLNPPKKQMSPLFAIPAEIIARIGLDLSVLNPVTGTIYFHLQEGKVMLTRFKDVYSDGKLSRFYLSSNQPSYMDFKGNLSIQVRMKQYNLLFKLAELFTFSINGDLKRPTYRVQKQAKREQSLAEQSENETHAKNSS
jgi:hypothetical protein